VTAPITGYRVLTEKEVTVINEIKAQTDSFMTLLRGMRKLGPADCDQRNVSIAITHLEDCSMRAVKAIARPDE
jgi:hypothetical protein